MADLHDINARTPRRLGEVEWTESGLRLSPVQRVVDSGWFWPCIVTLPVGAFAAVFFWFGEAGRLKYICHSRAGGNPACFTAKVST